MKIKYTFVPIFFLFKICFSQTTPKTCSIGTDTFSISGFLVGNCNPELLTSFKTFDLRESEPMQAPTYGHTYYKYLITVRDAQNNDIIVTKTLKPSQYSGISQNQYLYNFILVQIQMYNHIKLKYSYKSILPQCFIRVILYLDICPD